MFQSFTMNSKWNYQCLMAMLETIYQCIKKRAQTYLKLKLWANYLLKNHIYIGIFGQHFFVNTYLIKKYWYLLCTHFCIYLFELSHWFYGILRELVYKPPIINLNNPIKTTHSASCSIAQHLKIILVPKLNNWKILTENTTTLEQ